jgi:hypothetical protein
MRVKKKLSAIGLPRSLAKFANLNKKRTVYLLNPIEDCRKDFEEGIGHTIKWGD